MLKKSLFFTILTVFFFGGCQKIVVLDKKKEISITENWNTYNNKSVDFLIKTYNEYGDILKRKYKIDNEGKMVYLYQLTFHNSKNDSIQTVEYTTNNGAVTESKIIEMSDKNMEYNYWTNTTTLAKVFVVIIVIILGLIYFLYG